jgi:MerR family transcriptional regulator, redox-sensitive transcriptional activator SoxR
METTLSIGDFASRSGLSVSAVRFYEQNGLITSTRTSGNQRRYARTELRRLAVVRAARQLGMPLTEIQRALAALPAGRVPTRRDWTGLSRGWRATIDQRIADLQALKDRLDGCIGCGCLSLQRCALYNAGDAAAEFGSGPRLLLSDQAEQRSSLDRPQVGP